MPGAYGTHLTRPPSISADLVTRDSFDVVEGWTGMTSLDLLHLVSGVSAIWKKASRRVITHQAMRIAITDESKP